MFQLQNITIYKHPVFGNADINFGRSEIGQMADGGNMISVIIGKNGIGKSYLLRAIVDIFKTLDGLKNDDDDAQMQSLPYRFSVRYNIDGHIYTITNTDNGIRPVGRAAVHAFKFCKDGQNVRMQNIKLPGMVIASSMTIVDKFPTPSMGIYRYRGVRNERTPSTTGTRTIVRKAVDGIIDSLAHKHTTSAELKHILTELGFQPHLEIKYKVRYRNVFFRPDMSPDVLAEIYANWQKYFPNRKGVVWGEKYYRTLSNYPDKIKTVCLFIRRYTNKWFLDIDSSISYDVLDENNQLLEDAEAIKLLSNLDILSFPEFKVFKQEKESGYNFVNSSSGEIQQLCQFISIMSAINRNSLVLIDEPENSSHPNWQMNYVGWLQNIFKDYQDCHFLIATHSHFLLTDMRPEWSRIIALGRDGQGLKNIVEEGVNTYSWSADDILYRVFHVRNTRNYDCENDIMRLYTLIENGQKGSQEAKCLYRKLKSYQLPGNDPLLTLLNMMKDA